MSQILTQSKLYSTNSVEQRIFNKSLEVTGDIIDSLDIQSLGELFDGGYLDDRDQLLDDIFQETQNVLTFFNEKLVDKTLFKDISNLGYVIEESWRKNSYNYFVDSVLHESFQISWYHIEWGQLLQIYKYLCILAARDHCFGEDTKVRMYDGSVKRVQDVQVDDLLMGPDSKPRKVLSLHSGIDKLFKINQTRGDSYVVNSNHILSLYHQYELSESKTKKYSTSPHLLDMSIKDYQNQGKYKKEYLLRGYKVGIEYEKREVLLDPYFLGLWLGDGNSHDQGITNIDKEIIDFLYEYAESLGLTIRREKGEGLSYWITEGYSKKSSLRQLLKNYNLISNKHIPEDYQLNTREVRLQLLAGLIDSDGSMSDNIYYYTAKDKQLVQDIQRLANGLGFRCYYTEDNSFYKNLGRNYQTYQLTISGMLDEVPVKVPRKKVVFNGKGNSYKKPATFNNYNISVLSVLKIEEYGKGKYYGFECDGDHRFLLADSTVVHNSKSFVGCFSYPLWRMYGYQKPNKERKTPKFFSLAQEGLIITNEYSLAKRHLKKIREEIEENPILRAKLLPDSREGWSKEEITCKNGAYLTLKSYGSSMRGPHPGYIIVDDFLDKSCLYSVEQREKFIDTFHSEIMNMVLKDGSVGVFGTPFHDEDLYGNLKKSDEWKVFEYPGIQPDGRILDDTRHSFEELMNKRKSQGSIAFSREILVKPVTDASTIFPYSMVSRCFTDNYSLVQNFHSAPKEFVRIVCGVDLARSSNVGADDTVFTTLGIDEWDNYWLLNLKILHGASLGEQINQLKALHQSFRHEIIVCENNQMQQFFVDAGQAENLPMVPHTTGTNKYDLDKGLPSLALLFEQQKIRLPRGSQFSIDMVDQLVAQLTSITWTDKGKLEGSGSHDDMVMSLLMSVIAARKFSGFDLMMV